MALGEGSKVAVITNSGGRKLLRNEIFMFRQFQLLSSSSSFRGRAVGSCFNFGKALRQTSFILVPANRCIFTSSPSHKGLADDLLKSQIERQEQNKKSDSGGGGEQSQGGEPGGEEDPKGPKPLSKWQKIGYWTFGIVFVGTLVSNAILFALPDRDYLGENIPDEFSELPFPTQHYRRLKAKIFKTKKEMEDPFSDKLLPEPLPEPYYQPKYTILIELTGTLIHSNWTHKHGWRFQKRPGVDMFLNALGYPNFELVIFTTENCMTFQPIAEKLDPGNSLIMYKLYRDATRYVNGQHKKDLSALNRDLSKVIVVDWNENVVDCHRDNAIVLQKWEGDNSDRSLIGLAQLLNAIRESDVDDVREVLHYYKQFEDPIEAFRENQRKLQDEMALAEEKLQEQRNKSVQSSSLFSGLSRGFSRR